MCDTHNLFDKLNVYYTSKDSKITNVMYSEFGISDIYGSYSDVLEDLDRMLEINKDYCPI